MATFHPSIAAREVHNTSRIRYTNNGVEWSVRVFIASVADAYTFVEDLLYYRYPFVMGGDAYNTWKVRPIRAEVVEAAGQYTANAAEETITSNDGAYVDLTYTSFAPIAVDMFGQKVLVTEKITNQTEYLNLDSALFCWDIIDGTGTGTGSHGVYVPLRGPDEAPGMRFQTFKVDMTIERVNIYHQDGANGAMIDALENISGTVNFAAVNFFTFFSTACATETLLAQVNSVEVDTTRQSSTGGYGTGTVANYWWKVSITFSYKKDGWNKFFKAHPTIANAWGWYNMRRNKIKGSTAQPIFKPYPLGTTDYFPLILSAASVPTIES